MYKKGVDRLEKELCIEKAVKNIRDMKILIKSKFMTEEEKFKVMHNFKNIIDLEEKDCQSEDSDNQSLEEDLHNNDL